ncbi:MAG: bifunctional adenosylcobinamide kinase/adenosylcobinamide-phosphate guanylyltransferase [Halomonas sp.]|uniref:bifunctional adenosylcobinamide kinase/adenosylcobinamide-phosphate guanylyltransferase n=1 Tax=Halomonas sp. TaxID=1486246 RepID=UPI003F932625
MQVFIGGACAGKRDAVTRQYPLAHWARVGELGDSSCLAQKAADKTLVVSGWLDEIGRRIEHETSDDALRAALADKLDELLVLERQQSIEVIVILNEVGRGIVPIAAEARRLRDLAGWLAQDAVKRAAQVWYVRHGLVRELASTIDLP